MKTLDESDSLRRPKAADCAVPIKVPHVISGEDTVPPSWIPNHLRDEYESRMKGLMDINDECLLTQSS